MGSSSTLRDRIMADMKSAMKNKDALALQALKLVYAECRNKEIEIKADLDDAQLVSLLKKQIKQYEESMAQYEKSGRMEGVQEQKKRRDLIQSYLPKPLSEQELKQLIEKTISDLDVTSMKQMGTVIKSVQSSSGGSVDNRLLVELVKERLQAI